MRWSDFVSHCRRSPRCSRRQRRTCSPSTPSPPTTGPSCARPTHSNGSTARSAGARTSSASSRTTARSSASPPQSSSSRTTSGSSGGATSALTPWRRFSTKRKKKSNSRRCESSPRPEQPTMPASYTTSWDLTRAGIRCRRHIVKRRSSTVLAAELGDTSVRGRFEALPEAAVPSRRAEGAHSIRSKRSPLKPSPRPGVFRRPSQT
jgi:hypothetical protein